MNKIPKNKIKHIKKKPISKEITCQHCNKIIIKPVLSGLFLACPHCNRLINGQYPINRRAA